MQFEIFQKIVFDISEASKKRKNTHFEGFAYFAHFWHSSNFVTRLAGTFQRCMWVKYNNNCLCATYEVLFQITHCDMTLQKWLSMHQKQCFKVFWRCLTKCVVPALYCNQSARLNPETRRHGWGGRHRMKKFEKKIQNFRVLQNGQKRHFRRWGHLRLTFVK